MVGDCDSLLNPPSSASVTCCLLPTAEPYFLASHLNECTPAQIASGLAYLHHVTGMVHRDLKTPNILMDHIGKVRTLLANPPSDSVVLTGSLDFSAHDTLC